jgi:exodeoxyribonuclease III
MITTRAGQVSSPQKDFPSSVVVWNGNGIRARWLAIRNELKCLVHAINPDLLCFIESKVNSEKLLALQGFEDWANERGFLRLFCYWSTHTQRKAHGGEGVLIFTKIPCVATYGIGDPSFDNQARVVTLEFPQVFILISYNPQGGFSEESLSFRESWEKAFIKFLGGLRTRGEREGKGVIWAGDFNVNPLPGDWSDRAFDQIRHKIKKGTSPAGAANRTKRHMVTCFRP